MQNGRKIIMQMHEVSFCTYKFTNVAQYQNIHLEIVR